MITELVRVAQGDRAALHSAGQRAACRAAHRALTRAGTPVPLHALSIEKDVRGKPAAIISGTSDQVAVSISHSPPFVFAAADTGDVVIGVDVERVRAFVPTTWEAFLTPAEKAYIAHVPIEERDVFRTRAWSLKEATLKAFGVGLRVHPRHIDVAAALDGAARTAVIICRGVPYCATIVRPPMDPGHVAVVVAFSSTSGTLSAPWMFGTSFLPSLPTL